MVSTAAVEVDAVRRAMEGLAQHLGEGAAPAGSRALWADLITACQALVNTTTAVQHVAITRLVAIEEEWLEDGTTAEVYRAPGHVALDAPDIVAGALGVTHAHAQGRVAQAVRLAAGTGEPGLTAAPACRGCTGP